MIRHILIKHIMSLCSVNMMFFLLFFFSSRRRHTRCSRDWSSDVCSSDLAALGAGRDRSDGALALIDYPHIRPRAVVHASTVELRAARIALPALAHVGYVRGASDRVPEALQAVGVPIELLGPDTLARGDLSRYDAIVIG